MPASALRFLIDRDIVVIPKSTHKERMEQNINVLDFSLNDDDIKQIETMDEGHGLIVNFDDANVRMGMQQALKKYNF